MWTSNPQIARHRLLQSNSIWIVKTANSKTVNSDSPVFYFSQLIYKQHVAISLIDITCWNINKKQKNLKQSPIFRISCNIFMFLVVFGILTNSSSPLWFSIYFSISIFFSSFLSLTSPPSITNQLVGLLTKIWLSKC